MKSILLVVSFGLAICYILVGCSEEEPPLPPAEKKKIVRPIIKPPEEKQSPVGLDRPKQVKNQLKGVGEVESTTKMAKLEEAEMPKVIGAERPREPEKVETGSTRKDLGKEKEGYYLVKGDESLSSIAGREEVFGDPLQWPALYRLNQDILGKMGVAPDLPRKKIPEKTRLKILTPHEMKENYERRANKYWVINILSAKREEEIVPAAVKLMEMGYTVYVTSAKIKGEDFLRLRVGFFKTRAEAEGEGKGIVSGLPVKGFWVVKIGKMEHKKYASY